MTSTPNTAPPISYCPPASETIDRFAYTVCATLGQQVDESYQSRDVVRGFADFIKLMTAVYAESLNQPPANLLDNLERVRLG